MAAKKRVSFETERGNGGETHQRISAKGSHSGEGHLTTNQGIRVSDNQNSRDTRSYVARSSANDLTCLFWTKLCEKLSLERSFGYGEEEVQRGADRGGTASDRSVDVSG